MVGRSGASGVRARARHGERADLTLPDERQEDADRLERHLYVLAQQCRNGLAAAAIRHADDVRAGARNEQLRGQVRQPADAGMCVIQLARVGLDVIEQLLDAGDAQRGIDHQDLEALRELRDRREVLQRIVAGRGRNRRIDGEHAGVANQQRIAVRRRRCDRAGAQRAAGPRPVLHHARLAELRNESRGDPRRDVGRAARCARNDQLDRVIGIGLGGQR